MNDLLDRALAHVGEAGTPVLGWSVRDGEVVMVLDKGIKGCPKYRVPLSLLPEPAAEPEPEAYWCAACGREFGSLAALVTHGRFCAAAEGDEEE
jgi:hypothetical protein